MWKWISGVLVLANVAVFGVLQMQEKPREVDVSTREMNAAQVRPLSQRDLIALKLTPEQGALLSASMAAEKAALEANALESEDAPKTPAPSAAKPETPAASTAPTVTAAAAAAQQATQQATPTPAPSAPNPADKTKYCYHWGDFDEGAAAKAKQRLIRAGLGSHVVEIIKQGKSESTSGATKFWVYIPKSGDRESSVRRVLSLREKGFEAFVVNQRGEFEHAISLGLFSKKASADTLIAKLSAAGIADVKLHLRGGKQDEAPSGKISYLRLKALNAAQKSRLETLSSEWPQATLKNIACQ